VPPHEAVTVAPAQHRTTLCNLVPRKACLPLGGRCFAARLYQRAPNFYSNLLRDRPLPKREPRTPFEIRLLYMPGSPTPSQMPESQRLPSFVRQVPRAFPPFPPSPSYPDDTRFRRYRTGAWGLHPRLLRCTQTVPRRYRPFGLFPLPWVRTRVSCRRSGCPLLPILLSPYKPF
jgi:hypothetical protein